MSEKILPLPPSRQTLTDSVYEAVTELVMDQHIAAGARVNIDLVARQLNVSPTPVREALARLEMDGLRGALVQRDTPSPQDWPGAPIRSPVQAKDARGPS